MDDREETSSEYRVQRYAELSKPVRDWLEKQSKEDLQILDEAIRFYGATKTVGQFWKWLVMTLFAIFIAFATMGEKVVEFVRWLRGAS